MIALTTKSKIGSAKSFTRGWLCFAVLGLLAMMTSCAVGPNYKRPKTGIPEVYRGETELSTNSVAELAWWQVFKDDSLDGLIRTALTNNYDMRIAVARVEQARAMADEARAEFFPQIGYQGAVSRGKNAANGFPTDSGKRQPSLPRSPTHLGKSICGGAFGG